MTKPADSIQVYQSITGTLNTAAASYLQVGQKDGTLKSIAKLTSALIGYPLIALIGLVETAVRHSLLLIAKLFQFVIPKEYTETFDHKILLPLYRQAAITTAHTLDATTKTVTNLIDEQTRRSVEEKIYTSTQNAYGSKWMEGFLNLHINGFKESLLEVES